MPLFWPWSLHTGCPYDEPVWRGPDVVEGIAGDQSQLFVRCRIEHFGLVWGNHPERDDAVLIRTRLNDEPNAVVDPDLAKAAEKRVAMSGQHRVSVLAWTGSPANVADGEGEGCVVDTLAHDRSDSDARDLDPAEGERVSGSIAERRSNGSIAGKGGNGSIARSNGSIAARRGNGSLAGSNGALLARLIIPAADSRREGSAEKREACNRQGDLEPAKPLRGASHFRPP